MLNSLKIGAKLYLGFGLIIVMLLGIAMVGWIGIRQVNHGLQVAQYFGTASDSGNKTIINGERAKTASAIHIYGQNEQSAATVATQIASVSEHLKEVVKLLESDPYNPSQTHNETIGLANEALAAATEYGDLDKQYADLQKKRDERDILFQGKYLETGKILGEILSVANAPYTEQISSTSTEGEIPLLFFKMNKTARDCCGDLTAFKIAYDAYQMAIGEKEGLIALEKVNGQFKSFQGKIAAFDPVPFDAGQKAKIAGIRNISIEMEKDLAFITETTNQQNKTVTQLIAKEMEFDKKTQDFMSRIEKIYMDAEQIGVDATQRATLWVSILGITAFVLALLVAGVIAQDITSALKAAAAAMDYVAKEGDLSLEIPRIHLERQDEIGGMANSLKALLDEFKKVGHLAKELAAGNWRQTVSARGELDQMNIDLAAMVDQVNAALGNTAEAIEQVATGAAQVAAASDSLSQGATESAASIEEISASINEIGGQTNTNAQNANEANKLAQGANDSAAMGQKMMTQMIDSMEAITKNSQDIQKVVRVIDDISFQTNLLALNAAVEAARAGVHGKGFAVVAEEVRNLASRSAKAAAETTEMIDNNSKQIHAGAEIAQQTGEMLDAIVAQSNQVASLLKEIANASSEQAHGVSQISQGLQQIDSVTQQNTASAEETASVSNQMRSQAATLQKLIRQFQLRKKA